jgi:predicted XRE-type DNA-binding protein
MGRTAKKGKTATRKKARVKRPKVELSSGNIFADIGLENPEELLLKAKLGFEISELIQKKGLTQAEVAKRSALDQPKISRLLNGQLSGFSVDRLFSILNRLGHSVEVRISAKEHAPEKSHTRVLLT